MASENPTPIRPASTVLLCRDGQSGLEVFMVVRHHQIDFASGALVFPGGKVDNGDREPALRERCDGAADVSDEMLPYYIAAVREAFEECGVLLAREQGQTELVSAQRVAALEHYREPLNNDEIPIGQFLETENLVLAVDAMHPYAHWITPKPMPKRFDTRFFIAEAPAGHVAIHDGGESVDSIWVNPARVLEEAQEGKWTIIFPTRLNLELLAQSETVADAIQCAIHRTLVTVEPWHEQRDGAHYLCIPKESPYPRSEEQIKDPTRLA